MTSSADKQICERLPTYLAHGGLELSQPHQWSIVSTWIGFTKRIAPQDKQHLISPHSPKDTGQIQDSISQIRRDIICTMALQQLLEQFGVDQDDRPGVLSSLARRAYENYQRNGNVESISIAIQSSRLGLTMTPDNSAEMTEYLSNLGMFLHSRYERTGEMADLEEAISIARQAVDSTPADHLDLARRLGNLGNTLDSRYERIGEIADLEEAILTARQAADSTPNHPDRAGFLNNLGVFLQRRYERTGEMADLEEAILTARLVVDYIPADYPVRAMCLNNLGNKLESRYERTGEVADLEEVILIARKTIDSTPADHPELAGKLNNLGSKLERRYERTGEIADLEEAILTVRQAADCTPADHPDLARSLNNLGVFLQRRYERTGEMVDLEEAILIASQTIDSTPADHPGRVAWLNNLGSKLESRYKRTGEMADLEAAILTARLVVDSIPADYPVRAICLNNLGNKLESRYERTGEVADLEEAILTARQAIDCTPADHPDLAGRLSSLGTKLGRRYVRRGEMTDLEEAISSLRDAWHCDTAIPFHRIQAGALCLRLLASQQRTDEAIELGKSLLDLLPTVNTRLLDRSDQQFVMSTFAGVAADLCSLLLQSGQLSDALGYLEKGRAVILGQLVDSRGDMFSLETQQPEIARRYQQLRDEVNRQIRGEESAARTQQRTRRVEALAELTACIQDIRRMTGHERFLLGQEVADMKESAAGGNIVVVNVTAIRSDAIVISPTAIKSIHLSRLTAGEAKEWLGKKWTGRGVGRSELPQKNREYLEYLSWLWKSCVEEILNEVQSQDSNSPPKIWWIGSGLASSMPFHAAGTYVAGSVENALSRAVSSYSPSIKALSHARQRAKAAEGAAERAQGSLLIATMSTTPTTPGNGSTRDLPGVEEEKNRLIRAVNGSLPVVHLDLPSVDKVVESLPGCSIAHFACHGFTRHLDPSDSGLILQNKGEQDLLTVRKVSELNLSSARIAYLSACSTAENKAARLADEVIHLVSGFQAAGFPHVIGCLWPSNDRVCVEVADRFYQRLLKDRRRSWSDWEVAAALRSAVMEVCKTDWDMPLIWAQFVHFGV